MSEKVIAIRQADGSYYPIMKEGETGNRTLQLTTVRDDQTTVKVNLYKMTENSTEEPKYMDTLLIENLKTHPQGEATLDLDIKLDENGMINAEIKDEETGTASNTKVSLVTLAENSLDEIPDFTMTDTFDDEEPEETELFEPSSEDISDDDITDSSINTTDDYTEQSTDIEEPAFEDNDPPHDTDNELEDLDPELEDISTETPPEEPKDLENDINFNELPEFDDFDMSDTNESTEKEASEDFEENTDSVFSEKPETDEQNLVQDPNPSQLYDENLSDKVEEVEMKEKRKMHIPIAICIICALLCIIAVIFIFIFSPFPAKTEKLQTTISENIVTTEAPTPDTIVPAPVDTTPETASENTIEIVKEDTVPEPVTPVETPKDVEYLLKWGDTLWDLSNTYYRNPWLYNVIAKHNNIKDPDWIIAGTYINIPPR
jgi:nucleoid-associated protein YgaU